jgi:hypothetical protein
LIAALVAAAFKGAAEEKGKQAVAKSKKKKRAPKAKVKAAKTGDNDEMDNDCDF